MGRGKVGDSRGDTQAKKAKSSFGEDRWISLARRARQGRDPLAEEEIVDLQNCIMKFWFLLDSDLLGVITKGDLRWADVAMARIDYLEAHIDQVLLGKCLEGDEESLCELHRMLMNEGWWDRAENLDLRKTVWRRDESWDEMVGLQERELKEYILSRSELVHPNVISMVRKEDREGIRMALNHIHYNSIRESRSVKQMKAMVKEGKELKTGNHDSKAVEGEGINYKSALLKTRGSMSERPIEVPKEHKKVVRPQLGINVENEHNALEFGDCASDDYLVGNVENEREESEHEMEDAEGSVEIVYETPVNAVEVTGKKQSLSRESSIQDCQKEMCNSHGLTNSSKEVLTCYEDQITSKEGVLSNCREIIVKETRAEEDVQLDDCMGGDHIRNSNANGEIYNKEIVVASAQAGDQTQLSDCSIDDRIWHTRDDDLSSVSSKLGQTLSWEDSNVSSREFEDEPRSDESVRIMEGKMIRMNLGRKRGRPAKRKTNKVNLPFALKNKEQPVANITGKSEAEKIYETCLLMGLEGQVNRDEAIRKIADRLSVR
ncbi:hypothetical protein ACET3Z_002377 [Daucus carota]